MRSLVVFAHPDPDSFASALRDRVVDALRAAGDEVRQRDLYAEGFEPALSAGEHERHLEPGADPEVAEHVVDLQWCQQLLLVYPTWWSGQPAILKGWFDRVWVRGAVWELPTNGNRLRGRLHNVRRIVAVTTHGSPKWINALQGEPGKRVVTRTLRSVCGWRTTTRWIAMYGLDRATDTDRAAFLESLPHRLRSRVPWARRPR